MSEITDRLVIAHFACEVFEIQPSAFRTARVRAGLTLEAVARSVGVSRQWIHRLETDGGRITSDTLDIIMALFQTNGVHSYTDD